MRFNFRDAKEDPLGSDDGIAIADGFVYVLEGQDGLLQIGVSRDPATLLAQTRAASPFAVSLAYVCAVEGVLQNAYDLEGNARKILDRHPSSGQWFDIPLAEAVAAITATSRRAEANIVEITPGNIGLVRRLSAERKARSTASAASKRRLYYRLSLALLSISAVSLGLALMD